MGKDCGNNRREVWIKRVLFIIFGCYKDKRWEYLMEVSDNSHATENRWDSEVNVGLRCEIRTVSLEGR